ncbi:MULTISPECIES: hypothetical protein [Halobacteriovorax]|uniref:Uncharacterized protein n=1 Tax=Halobacteriovorax vibrionivorans TaxID=2152716 RepID=A0ABY0ID81_9BACT|nr:MULTISPECIES: hypothetical protein [Halobacteriovorax]AYF44835.1 hypothetical protein BALOs_1835 [Halobacteriovorax sp. BALOs_7]RZF20912.1 hypothetical protein DAY19_13080 [Halobacteriovorax vibrionivorans]TGD46012.1 hypothetical protein EP118_13530 [Halobacteriovorax sp. Y22]
MKGLLVAATLVLSVNVSASVLKVCAKQANEVCKEITNKDDFMACHNAIMDSCLNGPYYASGNKSMPWCYDECALVADEAQRNLCYETCNEK